MPWKETKTWFLLNGFVYEKGGGVVECGGGAAAQRLNHDFRIRNSNELVRVLAAYFERLFLNTLYLKNIVYNISHWYEYMYYTYILNIDYTYM